jgi:hypothetical protein
VKFREEFRLAIVELIIVGAVCIAFAVALWIMR